MYKLLVFLFVISCPQIVWAENTWDKWNKIHDPDIAVVMNTLRRIDDHGGKSAVALGIATLFDDRLGNFIRDAGLEIVHNHRRSAPIASIMSLFIIIHSDAHIDVRQNAAIRLVSWADNGTWLDKIVFLEVSFSPWTDERVQRLTKPWADKVLNH